MNSVDVITSVNNPFVKRMAKLEDTKHRRSEGMFLCEGRKLVSEAIARADVRYLIVSADCAAEFDDLVSASARKGAEAVFLAESAFGKISTEKAPQGIIAVAAADLHCDFSDSCVSGHIFLADGIRDPGNLGTIIRTAGAMGVDTVILSDCSDIYNPKTVRASMGGIFRTNICITNDMLSVIRELRRAERRVFATALTDKALSFGRFALREDDVFLVGNEGHGLSDELIEACSDTVLIDMFRDTESLNVSVAASIIMWELSKTFSSNVTCKGDRNDG